MKSKFLSSDPLWLNGLLFFRVAIAYFFIYFGVQVFDSEGMKGYTQWSGDLGFSPSWLWAYAGKAAELLGGICLLLGLFTRINALLLTITMAVITFKFHEGKPLDGDALPFFLMLAAFIFFLSGPGKWSLDYWLFDRRKAKAAKGAYEANPLAIEA
ncbi:MAG TPA: DoxX family protein [Flavisolibacter sp.]|nr:DoxX family protein [Flavisolibacter sp.]